MTTNSLKDIKAGESIRYGRPFGNMSEEFEWEVVKKTKVKAVFRVTWHGVFFRTVSAKKHAQTKDGVIWKTESET